MSESQQPTTPAANTPSRPPVAGTNSITADTTGPHSAQDRKETRRWWLKLFLQPLLFLAGGIVLLTMLGVMQRFGLLVVHDAGTTTVTQAATPDASVKYICPMMCTPPQSEPGRCPVCAMELVPTTSGGGGGDSRAIEIDPATRRVANIQTVAAKSVRAVRRVRAIGQLEYDEGTLRTISAYVDGRLDRLYADYTGIVVKKGDHIALLYSPRLYSGQIELLLAKKSLARQASHGQGQTLQSNDDLYASARQRLIELGMTESQIMQLEQAGKANSRLHLCAPISGTVIEKMAVEGQYVKEGQPICRLADLSTVWLMLKLFPEDAAVVHYGQQVTAQVHSLPTEMFRGRVAFIDPQVDSRTRTVGVRVVLPNTNGRLRVGDYATATVEVPMFQDPEQLVKIYDPELANKWIGPRHPQVVESAPGKCPICNSPLVPATRFGFTDQPLPRGTALVVPRNAVLMAGNASVVYVETKPGRFEIRRVTLGPSTGDEIVILDGVREQELVATRGNFLIDSQMQLVGNPSLIDPTKLDSDPPSAGDQNQESMSAERSAALAQLTPADRRLAERQQICPVTKMPLGSMGVPKKVDVRGTTVFICCEGCRATLQAEPDKYLAILAAHDESASSADDDLQMTVPLPGPIQAVDSPPAFPPAAPPVELTTAAATEQEPSTLPTKQSGPDSKEPNRKEVVR